MLQSQQRICACVMVQLMFEVCAGKSNPGELCSEEGIWTLDCDLSYYAWQPRPVTGDLPPQARAFAFTAASEFDHAYVAVLEESPTMGLQIYELDLQSWHWRRLPDLNTDFEMDPVEDTIATTFIQVWNLLAVGS